MQRYSEASRQMSLRYSATSSLFKFIPQRKHLCSMAFPSVKPFLKYRLRNLAWNLGQLQLTLLPVISCNIKFVYEFRHFRGSPDTSCTRELPLSQNNFLSLLQDPYGSDNHENEAPSRSQATDPYPRNAAPHELSCLQS